MSYTSALAEIDRLCPEALPQGRDGPGRADERRRIECTRQTLSSLVDFIT